MKKTKPAGRPGRRPKRTAPKAHRKKARLGPAKRRKRKLKRAARATERSSDRKPGRITASKRRPGSEGRFTHLEKIFWPKERFTKGDIIQYYDRIADVILPYLRNRPMVLNRHPNGIRGASFFQKNVDPGYLPPFASTVAIRAKSTGRNVRYILCNNKRTLLYLANLGCIEMHPWISTTKRIRNPDFLALDLDPGGNPFEDVIVVARVIRRVVEAAGGKCLVKTSGKTGIHVILPLRGKHDFADVRAVAKTIARIVGQRLPRLTTPRPNAGRRSRKIYIDYVRNSIGQTLAAPYSLRAYPGATVSTPLDWPELTKSLRPARFTLRTIFRRLNSKGDIWRSAFRKGVNLGKLKKRLQQMEGEDARHGAARHHVTSRSGKQTIRRS